MLTHRKYRRPCSHPHLIDHIFGASITHILLFASLFYKAEPKEHHQKTRLTKNEKMTIALAEDMARSTLAFGAMVRAPVLLFGLELPDTIVYKRSTAFVDFDFTFLFIHKFTCQYE